MLFSFLFLKRSKVFEEEAHEPKREANQILTCRDALSKGVVKTTLEPELRTKRFAFRSSMEKNWFSIDFRLFRVLLPMRMLLKARAFGQ